MLHNLFRRSVNTFCLISKSMGQKNSKSINNTIMSSKSVEQIKGILVSNHKIMNEVNFSAILQKMSQFQFTNHNKEDFQNILEIVTNAIQSKWISLSQYNEDNVRTLSNIVCYLSNLEVKSLNNLIQQLDVSQVIQISTGKQSVMFITGLIRLGVKQQYFKNSSKFLSEISYKKQLLNNKDAVVSVWRNLIGNNINTLQSDLFFAQTLNRNDNPWDSLISYTFYIYCYAKCRQHLPKSCQKQLTNFTFSENKKKVRVTQFTIFCNSLSEIKDLYDQKTLQILKDKVIIKQFYRFLGSQNIYPRQLSNLYQSMRQLQYDTTEVSLAVRIRFLGLIQRQNKIDMISFSYLFQKLITRNPADKQLYQASLQYYKKIKSKVISTNCAFSVFTGIYQFHKSQPNYNDDNQIINKIEEIFLQKQLKISQCAALLKYYKILPIFNVQICNKIRKILKNNKNKNSHQWIDGKLKQRCILGRQQKLCLKCYNNIA